MSSNNNQNAAEKFNFHTSQLGTTREKFIWTIENFSEYKECGEWLQSTEFITTTSKKLIKWGMKIYPNGREEESKDYVSLFIHCIDSNNEEVEAKYQFSIRKSDGKEFVVTKKYKKFVNSAGKTKGWGTAKLIKREDLFNAENGYFGGDRLTIVCKLKIQQEINNVEVPECQMEDMIHLFETGRFSDCKIISSADEKEFKVHKNILYCRSPVFGAMFHENNDNIIKIPDMNGDVIEKMLRFIYSGKEPDYGGMAVELLKAADKYELIRLKLFCQRKVLNSLGNSNACAMLTVANLYSAVHLKSAEQLKASALDFIKMNLKEVMESEGWNRFADEQLKDQILKAFAM